MKSCKSEDGATSFCAQLHRAHREYAAPHIKLHCGAGNGFRPFNLVFHILQLAGQFLIRDEVKGYECRIFKGGALL